MKSFCINLRQKTRKVHEALHGLEPAKSVFSGSGTLVQYAHYLHMVAQFEALFIGAISPANNIHGILGWENVADRRSKITEDLNDIPQLEGQAIPFPVCEVEGLLPKAHSKAIAMGYAYVHCGSFLGSAQLLQSLKKNTDTKTWPLRALGQHLPEGFWGRFKNQLEDAGKTPESALIVNSALAAFKAVGFIAQRYDSINAK